MKWRAASAWAFAVSAWACAACAHADKQPSPTSQPAEEIVLIRIGPETITQAEFNLAMQHATLDDYVRSAAGMIHAFIDDALLALYLKEHPDLVPESEVDKRRRSGNRNQ